ncbi:MAG TPA: hypothetical protein VFZ40_06640 [Pyrinomonadaceae bacterium]
MKYRVSPQIILTSLVLGVFSIITAHAQTVKETKVDCDKGDTINGALAKLNRREPNFVVVSGTCTESIDVFNYNDLAIVGQPGAVLIPDPEVDEVVFVNVAIRFRLIGFTINGSGALKGISLSRCVNCVVSNNTISGVANGVSATLNSSVDVSVNTINASEVGVEAAQVSRAILARNLIEHAGTPDTGSIGLHVTGNSYARVNVGSTFRGFGRGIEANTGGGVDIFGSPNLTDPDFPLIENNQSAGVRSAGGIIRFHGHTRVTGNGDSPYSGGIVIENGGFLELANLVEVINNTKNGVLLISNSTGLFKGGISISNNQRNGVVVISSSVLELASGKFGTNTVSGNTAQDIFCDSNSLITGGANVTGATKIMCTNLKSGKSDPIP